MNYIDYDDIIVKHKNDLKSLLESQPTLNLNRLLESAIYKQYYDCTQILLEKGANPNVAMPYILTSPVYRFDNIGEFLKLLLKYKLIITKNHIKDSAFSYPEIKQILKEHYKCLTV